MRRRILIPGIFLTVVGLFTGCGTVEETNRETPDPPVEAPLPQPDPDVSFQTTMDTVAAASSISAERNMDEQPVEIRYMIQIGAFKEPHNASKVQTLARERYKVPVMNDYNSQLALYQIRIGFFESREAAYEFRQRLISEHPEEYGDAWVVQLSR